MRIAAFFALVAVMLAGTAFAGDSGNGCKLQGTWYGDAPDFSRWIANYHGAGANEGTSDLEFINPILPPGTSLSSARGVWAKSGPSTFDYTLIYFLSDAGGNIILAIRDSGVKTLTDCNTMEITNCTNYVDPETLEPYPGPCVPSTATARRVLLQEPSEP